jgi:hypothetical protein
MVHARILLQGSNAFVKMAGLVPTVLILIIAMATHVENMDLVNIYSMISTVLVILGIQEIVAMRQIFVTGTRVIIMERVYQRHQTIHVFAQMNGSGKRARRGTSVSWTTHVICMGIVIKMSLIFTALVFKVGRVVCAMFLIIVTVHLVEVTEPVKVT